MIEKSQLTCGQFFSPDRSQEKNTCPTLTELQKKEMLKIKKFASENLLGQVHGEEGDYSEYIKLPKRKNSTEEL